jgi:hypothetical protein
MLLANPSGFTIENLIVSNFEFYVLQRWRINLRLAPFDIQAFVKKTDYPFRKHCKR